MIDRLVARHPRAVVLLLSLAAAAGGGLLFLQPQAGLVSGVLTAMLLTQAPRLRDALHRPRFDDNTGFYYGYRPSSGGVSGRDLVRRRTRPNG